MKNSKIEWCDHTHNAWEGCTKVSPGCANCYAEESNKRYHDGKHWGPGAPRLLRSDAYWKEPLKWNKEAQSSGVRQRVFSSSFADWLDEEGPIDQLARLLGLIHDTPNLDWLLLTKRPQNWRSRLEASLEPASWPGRSRFVVGWLKGNPPLNVWVGTTVEDQQRADERIPELLKIPAKIRFLSCEPLLGQVDLKLNRNSHSLQRTIGQDIHQVICGGESGPKARPMHPEWARSLRDQCENAGVPFFFKQWGEWGPVTYHAAAGCDHDKHPTFQDDQFNVHALAPGNFLEGSKLGRIGKSAAGRMLDGKLHDGLPNTR